MQISIIQKLQAIVFNPVIEEFRTTFNCNKRISLQGLEEENLVLP